MIKKLTNVITICILTLALTGPILAQPKDSDTAQGPEKKGSKAERQYPFRGKLAQVDKTQKTITLAGKEKTRVLQITSKTKLTRAGKPAMLDEAVTGEEVSGLAAKNAEGKEEAVSVRFGVKPEKVKKKRKTAEE